jgi:hypothetical protein
MKLGAVHMGEKQIISSETNILSGQEQRQDYVGGFL